MPEVADIKELTLETLCEGAAEELFQGELRKVLDNILDPNTGWKPVRRIRLEITFSAGEEREAVALGITATSKLQTGKGAATIVYVGRRDGRVLAIENNPRQRGLFNEEPAQPQLVNKGA